MKAKIILFFFTIITTSINAQWNPQGTTTGDIYYNAGNVGIGTDLPNGRLHLRDGSFWSSNNYGATLIIDGSHHNSIGILDASNSNPLAIANESGSFIIAKMPPLGNTTSPPEKLLTINPFGFFALGTDDPKGHIHIKDGAFWSSFNYGANLVIDGPHHNSIAFLDASSSNPIAIANVSGKLTFAKMPALGDVSNAPTSLMTIDNNGKVGIGAITTDAKLTVAGDVSSREVRVTINAGSDFVFQNDYNLRALNEVERFIKENGHLPDVAPAKEMEANGIELGKMDMKLLQKIEELTLYMLDFKREMDKVKEENQKLKERVVELEKD